MGVDKGEETLGAKRRTIVREKIFFKFSLTTRRALKLKRSDPRLVTGFYTGHNSSTEVISEK